MKKILSITEPGYLYDLFYIFVFHFNTDYCFAHFIDNSREAEEKEYFLKMEEEFGPIPEELRLFFQVGDDRKVSFITRFCYDPHIGELRESYNFSTVQNDLSDHQRVAAALLKYYFTDLTEKEVEQCLHSVTHVGRLIRNSSYSGELKSSLYAFFLEPSYMTQKLSYELIKKEVQLAQWREKNMSKILHLEHQVDFQKLSAEFKQYKVETIDIDRFQIMHLSPCVLMKNCVKMHFYGNEMLLLLGVDYVGFWNYLISQNLAPKISVFGNAIAEDNRIGMLDLMLEKGEVTIKDLERKLDLTGTNAYYHLSLMIKANMIKSPYPLWMTLNAPSKTWRQPPT